MLFQNWPTIHQWILDIFRPRLFARARGCKFGIERVIMQLLATGWSWSWSGVIIPWSGGWSWVIMVLIRLLATIMIRWGDHGWSYHDQGWSWLGWSWVIIVRVIMVIIGDHGLKKVVRLKTTKTKTFKMSKYFQLHKPITWMKVVTHWVFENTEFSVISQFLSKRQARPNTRKSVPNQLRFSKQHRTISVNLLSHKQTPASINLCPNPKQWAGRIFAVFRPRVFSALKLRDDSAGWDRCVGVFRSWFYPQKHRNCQQTLTDLPEARDSIVSSLFFNNRMSAITVSAR